MGRFQYSGIHIWGEFTMQVKTFGYAALWAAVAFLTQTAFGQNPYGYPAVPAGYSAGGEQAPFDAGVAACGDACCEPQGWHHRFNAFGEYMLLRARNADIAYALPVNGPVVAGAPGVAGLPGVQQGPVGIVDPDYSSGFRIGGGFTLDECSQIQLTYSEFDETTASAIAPAFPDVLRSLVLVPDTSTADTDFLNAAASETIQFKLVDLDYRGLLAYSNDYKVSYLVGARYAKLDQDFIGVFSEAGVTAVNSTVNFDGGGLRVGLEAERYGRNQQMFVYGKGYASLIGGQFRSSFVQGSDLAGVEALTSWKAGRLVGIYDLEVGAGWENYCGNFRVSAGYMFSVWTNTVKNNEWINSVRTNNYTDPSDNFAGMISFDGIVARAELLW